MPRGGAAARRRGCTCSATICQLHDEDRPPRRCTRGTPRPVNPLILPPAGRRPMPQSPPVCSLHEPARRPRCPVARRLARDPGSRASATVLPIIPVDNLRRALPSYTASVTHGGLLPLVACLPTTRVSRTIRTRTPPMADDCDSAVPGEKRQRSHRPSQRRRCSARAGALASLLLLANRSGGGGTAPGPTFVLARVFGELSV